MDLIEIQSIKKQVEEYLLRINSMRKEIKDIRDSLSTNTLYQRPNMGKIE